MEDRSHREERHSEPEKGRGWGENTPSEENNHGEIATKGWKKNSMMLAMS